MVLGVKKSDLTFLYILIDTTEVEISRYTNNVQIIL